MSSAPAVPTSESRAAPTTQVESTQEAPHGQSVSAIGHEGAGPDEAMLHTGAFNTIDMYMRMQFLALASFQWTTQQAPGTLLWSAPITPKTSHQFIRHLAQMYNTWVGGFDYNVKVCGTGFHAGALAVVRLPPNILPSSVSSPADFTAFEYKIIDPKTLEVVTEHIIDQRRWMYHYMDDSGRDSIGGYIAVYVLIQLNTSSTGSQAIATQILTRPAANFNFFQIKPLASTGGEPDPEEPIMIANAIGVTSSCTNGTALFVDPLTQFTIAPASQAVPKASLIGCYNLAGEKIGSEKSGTFPISSAGHESVAMVCAQDRCTVSLKGMTGLPPSGTFNCDYAQTDVFAEDYVKHKVEMIEDGKMLIVNYKASSSKLNAFYNINNYIELDRKVPFKNSDESYFMFSNRDSSDTNQGKFSFQSQQLAKIFKTGDLKDLITPQEAMIFDMYDKDLDIPIRRLKLYYSGIMTTKPEADQVDLPANQYYFKFVQTSRISEPIPAPPKEYKYNSIISQMAATYVKSNNIPDTFLQQ